MARASRRLRALRTPKAWDQHPVGGLSTLGMSRGPERAGGAPRCDALSQTHQSHTTPPLYVSATQSKPMSLSGRHSQSLQSNSVLCGTSICLLIWSARDQAGVLLLASSWRGVSVR